MKILFIITLSTSLPLSVAEVSGNSATLDGHTCTYRGSLPIKDTSL